MNEIRYASGFSGIGGFDLGLNRTEGFKRVWSCDNNRYANEVYTKHFGEENHHSGDIEGVNTQDIPDIDLFCAGFPCQAFSVAGKRKGFQDTRGTLFFEICRIAEAKRPPLLLLENVKGLLSHDGGRTFTVILQSLDELGYWFEWQVLNSKYFGVPQNRERVFIVGHLRGGSTRAIFPITESNGVSTKEFTGGKGIASALDANYYKGARRQRTFIASELQKIGNIAESGHDSIWGRVYDPEGIAMNLNAEGGGLGAKTGLYAIPVLTPDRLDKRQHGRRFKESGDPAFTLTGQDKHGIYDGAKIRRLTPVECERLQGFPDRWTEGISDTQRYRVLGNAVTVNVIEFLGKLIKSEFTNKEGSE